MIEVVAEKLHELYLVSAERCVNLLAMKDAQMCCFRSYDCFYCGSIEKTYTEFWAIMWILFPSQGHSAALSFTAVYVQLLWRNEQEREVVFKMGVWLLHYCSRDRISAIWLKAAGF